MNDGSIDYKNHHSVDSLAFGHCNLAYRNLGRPSSIQIKQVANSFEVIVDHRQCFFSDKVCVVHLSMRSISRTCDRSSFLPNTLLVFRLHRPKVPTHSRPTISFSPHPNQSQEKSPEEAKLPHRRPRIICQVLRMRLRLQLHRKTINLPIYIIGYRSWPTDWISSLRR